MQYIIIFVYYGAVDKLLLNSVHHHVFCWPHDDLTGNQRERASELYSFNVINSTLALASYRVSQQNFDDAKKVGGPLHLKSGMLSM